MIKQKIQEFITKQLYEKYYPDCLNYYKYLERHSVIVWRAIYRDQVLRLKKLKKIKKLDRLKK